MNIDIYLSPSTWLLAAFIFFLRVFNMSLDTVRVLFIIRGQKFLTWCIGFIQSLLFVFIISSVLTNMENLLNIIAYSAGFATGTVLGIFITERLALGFIHLTIVSSSLGPAIAEQLRQNGYAVTEVPARGKDGMVTMMHCDIKRKDMAQVEILVSDIDSGSFVTAEVVRPIRRGFWRAA